MARTARILPRRSAAALGLALLAVAACGRGDAPPTLAIGIATVEAADVLSYSGPAAIGEAGGTPGRWAAVPGLAQPERGRLARPDGRGGTITVALFPAPRGPVRVSAEAAAALGLPPGGEADFALTALRREPYLIEP